MKKQLLGYLLVLFAWVGVQNAQAQLTFTTDTAYVNLTEGTETFGYIFVNYSGATAADVKWRIIDTDFNFDWSQWQVQFCECSSCYTNEFGPLPDSISCTVAPNVEVEWKIGINPGTGFATNGHFTVEVEDIGSGQRDTLTWIADAPSSSNNIAEQNSLFSVIYGNGGVSINWEGERATTIDVYSVTGVLVHSATLQPGMSDLNLSGTEKGMYILKQGTENVRRIFIQ